MKSRSIKGHEWTEQEKNWIEARQKMYYAAACKRLGIMTSLNLNRYICQTCPYYDRPILHCPLFPNYKDAAEFEARVAKTLAKRFPFAMHMEAIKDNDFVTSAQTALMLVRLEVEQEMEVEEMMEVEQEMEDEEMMETDE